MSNYVKNILQRSIQPVNTVRPRLGTHFEQMVATGTDHVALRQEKTFEETGSVAQPTSTPAPTVQHAKGDRGTQVSPRKISGDETGNKEPGIPTGLEPPDSGLQKKKNDPLPVDQAAKNNTPKRTVATQTVANRLISEEPSDFSPARAFPLFKSKKLAAQTTAKQNAEPHSRPLQEMDEQETARLQERIEEVAGRDFGSRHLNETGDKIVLDTVQTRQTSFENKGILLDIPAESDLQAHVDIPEPYPQNNKTPSVQVTIGRIEIRAVQEQKQRPSIVSKPATPNRPALSLDTYLRQRNEGGQ